MWKNNLIYKILKLIFKYTDFYFNKILKIHDKKIMLGILL